MNNANEAINYLNSLKKFLYGDLKNFEDQSKKIELEEQITAFTLSTSRNHRTSSQSDGLSNKINTLTAPSSSFISTNSLQNDKPFPFRSTIPHALLLFSAIDIIGFLIGDEDIPYTTESSFLNFFKDNQLPKTDREILIKFYRHGMSHEFFPKKRFGVSYSSTNPENTLFFIQEDIVSLNVNYLIKLTKKRLESILANAHLYEDLLTQFKKLENADDIFIKKKDIDIEAFKKSLKQVITTVPVTTTSP